SRQLNKLRRILIAKVYQLLRNSLKRAGRARRGHKTTPSPDAAMPLALPRRAFLAGVGAFALPLPTLGQEPAPRVLEARPGKAQLLPAPAPATEILGFDGATPGPLLRYRQGGTLFARLVNKTEKPMSLHWQGLRG